MSAQYTQAGAKRQKVREPRSDVDYFQGIDKIEYNNMASPADVTQYRYYAATERMHSRNMEDWLKLSLSLSEFRSNGSDVYLRTSQTRPWDDGTNSMDNYKRCIKAFFELCAKLGIKYYTARDTDLAPWTDDWDEWRSRLDDAAEHVLELSQRYAVKLLWLSPDLHSNPRYISGALTNPDTSTLAAAACHTKKCLELSQRLNGECFLIWPSREGYDSVFYTDVAREIKMFAKLLKMTAEHRDRLNYRCQLLIMPYYSTGTSLSGNEYCFNGSSSYHTHSSLDRDRIHTYLWDATSCLYFLRVYNLERCYKVCCVPGHHMLMASVYNMLGGVSITMKHDPRVLTLMMKSIIDQGCAPAGGLNLSLRARRDGDVRCLITAHVTQVDGVARALRAACAIVADQLFSKHVQQRYASHHSGFGSRLQSGDVTMDDCEEHHKKNPTSHGEGQSCKLELVDAMFQRYLDTSDRI